MTETLHCIWRNDIRIKPISLNDITPIYQHSDIRFLSRDLPDIQKNGMKYPILLYKTTSSWWDKYYDTWVHPSVIKSVPVKHGNEIWVVKAGTNRVQVASHLDFKFIDSIMCDDSDECAKLAIWFRECDPLTTNKPYLGIWEYH